MQSEEINSVQKKNIVECIQQACIAYYYIYGCSLLHFIAVFLFFSLFRIGY